MDVNDVVIHGTPGSYAESYAEEHGYEFLPWETVPSLPEEFEQEEIVSEDEFRIVVLDEGGRKVTDAEVAGTVEGIPLTDRFT